MVPLLSSLLLAGCATESTHDSSADSAIEVQLTHQFSFVVIADPHIQGNADHDARLQAAVDWIEDQKDARMIEVVAVVGDIGWGEGLVRSRELLDGLSMPYLPVLGDNEVHVETGEPFDEVFGSRIDNLATATEQWRRGPVEVYNPVHNRPSWMQNYAFQHRGLTFVALDWVSRSDSSVLGELAELHDFEDGTLPWLTAELETLDNAPSEDVLLFSHHPMHTPSFNLEQLDRLTGLLGPLEGRIAANWAGHYHVNFEEEVEDGGYEVFVTDATWDDENTVRVVEVWSNGTTHEYRQELIVLE